MPAASKTSPLHLSSLNFHLFLYLSSSTHEWQSLAAGLGAVKPKRAHLWLPLGGNKWLTAWSSYLCKINITEREKERGRQHLFEQLEKLNPQASEQLPVSTAFFFSSQYTQTQTIPLVLMLCITPASVVSHTCTTYAWFVWEVMIETPEACWTCCPPGVLQIECMCAILYTLP